MDKAIQGLKTASFSQTTSPQILELHGSLGYVICLHCHRKSSRTDIQKELERLNSRWCSLLENDSRDLKINADGDVDIRNSSFLSKDFMYSDFRYPPCSNCLSMYGDSDVLQLDSDGAWNGGTVGIVKPDVIFFGENVSNEVRQKVEDTIKSFRSTAHHWNDTCGTLRTASRPECKKRWEANRDHDIRLRPQRGKSTTPGRYTDMVEIFGCT